MEPSQGCIDLIKSFEDCRLTAYQDAGGVWTIGYGHKMTPNVNHSGETITQAQADAYMLSDVRECARTISPWIYGPTGGLLQGQFDACVSFAYNLGTERFRHSTLLKKINECNMFDAAEEFLKWNRAAGKVLTGLIRRREAERAMFLGVTDAT